MRDDSSSSCGWMIKRCRFPDAGAVVDALTKSIIDSFEMARTAPGKIALMLAGGRTPKSAYQKAAEAGLHIPPAMHLMISDERWVPLDHPNSNRLMMLPFMNAVGCTPGQAIMVNTSLPREVAAADFGRHLDEYFQSGGILSTCFLGLGTDGHTASLFSDEHLQSSRGKSAISVDRPDGRIGISATPSIIQKAQRIVFVVTGVEKKEIAGKLLRHPLETTAGKVVFRHPNVELWIDN